MVGSLHSLVAEFFSGAILLVLIEGSLMRFKPSVLTGVVFGLVGLALVGSGLLLTSRANDVRPDTVNQVSLERYQGVWYEVARMPNRFQNDCSGNVRAEYSLLDNGEVKVVNSCDTLGEAGRQVAEGRAMVVDSDTNAKLKVTFVHWLRWWYLFGGAYWIIDLDEQNYSYAVVGHPGKNWGWILSRSPELPEETLRGIASRLNYQGYNVCAFQMTKQDGSSAPADISLCEVVGRPVEE